MDRASHPAQAGIADRYRQALRDAAMYPAIHYGLARARIADVHHEARRDAVARAARQARRPRAAMTMAAGEARAGSRP